MQKRPYSYFGEGQPRAVRSFKSSQESTKRRTSFLDLPGEVRNQIYRLVLTRQDAINGILTRLPGSALLRSCKVVHDEATSILYEENTFTFGIEINWTSSHRIKLYGFPVSLAVWPAPRYHQWLRKLYIQISFTPGLPADFEAPSLLRNDIQAMRRSYDEYWDELDITYELCEGSAHLLTFTMAWLKFRFFEPIAHLNCTTKASDKIPPLVRWCFERTMKQRDLKADLCMEQLHALAEANEIAADSYESGTRNCFTDLALRLVWGSPYENVPMASLNQAFLPFPPLPIPPFRRRMYDRNVMFQQLDNSMTYRTAREFLMEDNELRVLAALEMPQEQDLLIKQCAELRTYFALQEAAMKITALSRSIEER